MAGFGTFPVVLRIGNLVTTEIATIDFPVGDHGALTVSRKAIADMLRAAADAFEHPDQEEDPDAAS